METKECEVSKPERKQAERNGQGEYPVGLGKGLLKQKESWKTSLETILIIKERRVKEIYEKLKLYKTKKNKLELLEECKETLILTIQNPTMTLENQENEIYANLKAEKEMTGRR